MATNISETGKYEVTARGDIHKLHGKAIGLPGVLFLTVTGAAPISAMLFNVPIGVGYGNGLGAPAAFLVATVILLLFSVGYAAMARKVTAVGGFYSFISHGIGREAGMALGFGSIVAYCVFETSLAGGFAYFANADVQQWFGVNVPWPWFAFGMIAAIAVLSYLDVKMSAMILGVALIAEVLILIIFDFGVFGHSGNGATVNGAALNPAAAFQAFEGFKTPDGKDIAAGVAAIGLFFAFWSWVGFEMAPNYGEESRDPKRIVPLSLYISVLGLGIFYTITSWAAVSAYPDANTAIAKAANDSGNFFLDPAAALVGPWAKLVMSVLILTSSFACGMAFHNTSARYIYSLAREGVLPAKLGRTHPTYKSPHIASTTQSVLAAIIVVLFMIFAGTDDPNKQAYIEIYGLMALVGTLLIMFAQAVVSVAIILYFRRNHPEEHHWFETLLAPGVACAAQLYIIYLLLDNLSFLGSGLQFAFYIPWICAAVLVLGLGGALWLKSAKPEIYDQIGRLLYEGVPEK
ncbi:MAG TPA: APC family permease [Candidatus Binatia bacterium]|nr:APC family permease [Candidatus Binatia bacterium]